MHFLLIYYSSYLFASLEENNSYLGTPFHLTNPPNTDLEALPDPNLAN